MNKIKFIIAMILVILTTFMFNSCTKQESLGVETNLQSNSDQQITLPTVEFNKIISGFSPDMAIFSSRNEFAAFLQAFDKLTDDDQKILLNNLEYGTIDEILEAAYAGMDSIQTREEFIEYLSQYSDYLELITLPNGEEEVVEKDITHHPVYNFLNAAKIVKVGNVYQKYFSKLCVESENLELLKTINNENEVRNSRLKYFVAYTDNPNDIQNKNQIESRWGELGLIRRWEKQNDAFWCKNKRKVYLDVGFPYITYNLPESSTLGKENQSETNLQVIVKRQATVTAMRKGIPCIWYKYKTTITWNAFNTFYVVDKTGTISQEYWNQADEVKYASSIDRTTEYYVFYTGFGQYFDCQWIKIQSKITTTGLGGEWLIADFPN